MRAGQDKAKEREQKAESKDQQQKMDDWLAYPDKP